MKVCVLQPDYSTTGTGGTGGTTTTTGTGGTTTTTGTGGTNTTTGAGLNAIMQQRFDAMGLPPGTDLSPLNALSKYDFSKAAPQLRMAGTYTNPLLMPTKAGSPGVAPTYTPERAPTREEAFMQYVFPQGVTGVTDIEDNITRGLQFARNLNLTPTETLGLMNRALPANQYITPAQLQAAVEPRAGLLALAQQRTVPSVSFQRQLGKISDIPIRNVADEIANPAGAGVVKGGSGSYGIDIVSPTLPGQTRDMFAEGGAIHYAAGDFVKAGEKAYTLADFDISTPSVPVILPAPATTNPFTGTLGVPRNVLFNKELEAREATARPGLNSLAYLIDLQNQGIRQGRTGKEYIDLMADIADQLKFTNAQFPRIEARGPATYKLDQRGLPIRPANYYYAEGGDVGRGLGSIAMKGYAQEMAQKGRFGDTMLAHISPEEAQMLQAAGGAGTINPETGLPEYFSWRKLLKNVAKVTPFIVPFIPGLGLAAKALISGVAGGLGGQKGFDFKRGLMSGLMSYGIGSAAQNLGLTSGAAPTGAEAAAAGAGAAPIPSEIGSYEQFATKNLPQVTEAITGGVGDPSTLQLQTAMPTPSTDIQYQGYVSPTERMGAAPTPQSFTDKLTAGLEKAQTVLDKPIDTLYAVPMAVCSAAMVSEEDKYAQAVAAQKAEEERKKRLGLEVFLRSNFAGGGDIAAMVAGGATGPANEPRTINGAGDGMSDSVPATIEGVQEARLADGEFVIPADVVADLGNGSSNAGSKKLYAMMDRVRKARHGTTRQPPEVDTGRLMPA